MRDTDQTKAEALRVLRERGQEDAARALAGCRISLRHASISPGRDAGGRTTARGNPGEGSMQRGEDAGGTARPAADVLIHAPGELVSSVRKGNPPQFDWGNQIERAVSEAVGGDVEVRLIQWTETGPIDAPRPGTTGIGPSGGNATP